MAVPAVLYVVVVKRVSDENPNAGVAAWIYLAHPSFELPCWHCFQRADIAFNLISNLILGNFQVIARLEIHPERRTVVEVARETKGRVSSNCAFLVGDIGDPRHSVFGLLLLTTEPRTAGGATGGDGYVVVGIENLDC